MAEIITLQNGTVSKNYPSFHDNWNVNFDRLKESFNWVESNDTLMVQEPFVHEYFNELSMRTCLPRRICQQYANNTFGSAHRVHLLDSQKSAMLLSGEYWVEKEDYPSWAHDDVFIFSKSIWINEEGKSFDSRFNEFEEYYFKCPSAVGFSEYGFNYSDDDDTVLLSALVNTNGNVISYRKHEKNQDIDHEGFLDNWISVYIFYARKQGQKQFARNLFASGLI